MHLLGLDIGTKRTGVAFADTKAGFVVALDTIHHRSVDELCSSLSPIITSKKISELVIGLPRLLDGSEGAQSRSVREAAQSIATMFSLPITFMDERYSSMNATKESADSKAACSIVEVVVSQRKNKY